MNRLKPLEYSSEDYTVLDDAYQRVINQESDARKGNHAYLLMVLKGITKLNYGKQEGIEIAKQLLGY